MNKPQQGFVMQPSDESQPKSVTKVGEFRALLVEYIDGRGEKSAQIVFASPSGNTVYMLSEMIQGTPVAKEAAPWLREALKKQMAIQKGIEQV